MLYHNREVYINEKWTVFSPPNGKIEPNDYQFPFAFNLPVNLPGTFRGAHGSIHYFVRGHVHRSGLFSDKMGSVLPFTVAPIRDLNNTPEKQEPVTGTVERSLGVIGRKPVHVTVQLNKKGFVSGESVLISAQLDNESGVNIDHCKVSLRKTVTFSTADRKRALALGVSARSHIDMAFTDRTVVAKTRLGGVKKGAKVELPQVCLEIPADAPPTMEHCSLIDVAYTIKFECVPSGLHRRYRIIMVFLIDIGSVQFRDVGQAVPLTANTVSTNSENDQAQQS